MDAEYFSFNDGTDTKVIKDFSAVFPWVSISVLSDSLIIETVYSSDLSSLMVSSQECNVSGILQFQAKKKLESFNGIISTIDKITHENVAGIRYLSTLIK